MRYVIPCWPFLYVFAGRVVPAIARVRFGLVGLCAALIWLVVEYVAIWPDHLAYFNQLAGGPRGGLRWLDDSNVDWGQSLIQLRDHLQERQIADFRMCAFWHLDPKVYGIPATPIEIRDLVSSPPKGILVLSSHCVARVEAFLTILHGDGPRNWLANLDPDAVVGHTYYIYDVDGRAFSEPLIEPAG